MPNPTPARWASVFGDMLRVTRLDALGHPVVGGMSMYCTDNLVKHDFNPQIQQGPDVTQLNAQGVPCLSYRGQDTIRYLNSSLQVCDWDPELVEILIGGTVFTDTGTVTGYQMPALGVVGAPNGVGVEIWAKAIVAGAQVGWLHHVWPRVYLRQDNRSVTADNMDMTMTGWATQNPNFGVGPVPSTDPTAFKHDSTKAHQFELTTALPAAVAGYQAVAAPA